MPFPAKTDFKQTYFKAIKEGKADDALEMWCRHVGRHQFLMSCGLLIHYTMPHKIGLTTVTCTMAWKTDGGTVFLHHTLDWLKGELKIYTIPDVINEVIKIPLEVLTG